MLVNTVKLLLVSTLILQLPSNSLILNVAKRDPSQCNGSGDLCSRSYGNVTFAGSHDSYAIGSSIAANQNISITDQLNSGIRMLQAQAHNSTNSTITGAGIDLCHTSCSIYQGGAIENWLSQIVSWSNANPNEVITLLIVNSDGIAPSRFAQAYQSTGMAAKSYSPPAASLLRSQWPTLGTLITNNQPILTFMTPGADFNSVPYIIDEFTNIWENPYNQITTPFNCSIDRISSSVSNAILLMYISNQFLDNSLGGTIVTPNTAALNTTNSIDGTLSTSNGCAGQHGSYPNFILTDYSTTPNNDVVRAVAQMNGVEYTGSSSTSASPSSSPTSSSGGSSGSSGSSSGTNNGSNNGSSSSALHSYQCHNDQITFTLSCSLLMLMMLY